MVNKLNNLEVLKKDIIASEEYQNYRKLFELIQKDKELNAIIIRLREVEKQATNAKEFNLINAYRQYKNEYDQIIKTLEDNVLLTMYLDAKLDLKNIINKLVKIIETDISNEINE